MYVYLRAHLNKNKSYVGVMSWVLVIPFDVMKTIMQAESDPQKYGNMRNCLHTNVNVRLICFFNCVCTIHQIKSIQFIIRNMVGEFYFEVVGC